VHTTLFSGSISDGTTQTFAQSLVFLAGDTLVFAARFNAGLAQNTSQLDATFAENPVPEPATAGVLVARLALIGSAFRRRSKQVAHTDDRQ
jgi:hypothetical protein